MILADLHVHSTASTDGRSDLPALLAAARERGLQALAISDHDLCTALPESSDVLLIPAVEITTTAGHILGLFLERPVNMDALTASGYPTVKAAVTAIHACGGFAVLAHPFAPQKLGETELRRFSVDAVETQNARAALKRNHANDQAKALAAAMGKPMTGGSDAHCAEELGACCTRFSCEKLTLPALKAAFRRGEFEPVFDRPCRWKHKAWSRLERDRRQKQLSARTYIYYLYAMVRDLFQK